MDYGHLGPHGCGVCIEWRCCCIAQLQRLAVGVPNQNSTYRQLMVWRGNTFSSFGWDSSPTNPNHKRTFDSRADVQCPFVECARERLHGQSESSSELLLPRRMWSANPRAGAPSRSRWRKLKALGGNLVWPWVNTNGTILG